MDLMSNFDNLEVMIENEISNPNERELTNATEESSVHGDTESNMYSRNEFRDFTYDNNAPRQNEAREYMETFTNEFNLRLSQEMDSMMAMMHSQINRAISSAISDRVIPEIRNIVSSMSSSGNSDTGASSCPNSQENREINPGLTTKITKKDSRSVGDLRDTEDHGPYTMYGVKWNFLLLWIPVVKYFYFGKCVEFINLHSDSPNRWFMANHVYQLLLRAKTRTLFN